MKNVLLIDIETRATTDPKVIARLQAKVKPPSNYKVAETIAKWWASEGAAAKAEAVQRTALDGTYGKIASLAWAYGDETPTAISGDDERPILEAASELLQSDYGTLVAFNSDFDLRFLMQRMAVNRVHAPSILRELLVRNYHPVVFDPMKQWAGYKGFISQSDLADALGIEREDTTTGADIGDMIATGDWAKVEYHNVQDVKTLQRIYERMTL